MLCKGKKLVPQELCSMCHKELFPRSGDCSNLLKPTPSPHLPLPPDAHHEASRYWPCCARSPQCSFCCRPFNRQSSPSLVQCSPRAGDPSTRPPRSTLRRGSNIREDEK